MSRLFPITANRDLQSQYLVSLLRVTLAALVMVSATEVFASCGDYLLPPHAIAQVQQIPAEYGIDRPFGRHHEPPCRGPRCQEQPGHQQTTPVVPISLAGPDQHWLNIVVTSLPVPMNTATPLLSPLDLRPLSVWQGRIDRPPCAA